MPRCIAALAPKPMYEGGPNLNNRLFKGKNSFDVSINVVDSVVHDRVVIDINRLRDRPKFIYDRVPGDRLDQYLTWRQFD